MCLPPPRNSEQGFTLVEIILAVSLVGVIAAMVFSGLYLTATTIDRVRTATTEEQLLRSALQIMAEELRTSVSQMTSPWMGINAQIDGQAADTIAFLAVGQFKGMNTGQESELKRVIYTRERDQLLRFVRKNLYGLTDESIERMELLNKVKAFNVRYYDVKAGVWADEWDARARVAGPTAILIELTLMEESLGAEPRVIREWVTPGIPS
ncbi:hypothetical protein W02_00430 [Nitrospira sp. KM1]|uniref:type II secretion system protein GspJ n=1 Tax=Nitrospira sp. KM1 TaxID=1936990 RepID=UPI0013A77A09|nr:type II secretion system protein GspJ [Nitrospira sp. KM1]BCA52903.1 hypothetical protein W02_00430 [Nitrospira sp. KM1]